MKMIRLSWSDNIVPDVHFEGHFFILFFPIYMIYFLNNETLKVSCQINHNYDFRIYKSIKFFFHGLMLTWCSIFIFEWKETWSPYSCWHQTVFWYANPASGRAHRQALFGLIPNLKENYIYRTDFAAWPP